ncbi:MAG TPA: hypothetical protein ENJ09_10370 [Planctomycetes bacterium]|nr:hypothetical protein [Planctomycetota bacterium]
MKCPILCLPLLALSCATPPQRPEDVPIGFQVPDASDVASRESDAARLERVLAHARLEGDLRRALWAAYFLTDLETRAADEPFLTEPSPRGPVPSPVAHLVASIENAELALALLGAGEPEPMPSEIRHLVPGGLEGAHRILNWTAATSSVRLGFGVDVDPLLAGDDALRDPDRAPARLEELGIPAALRPWVTLLESRALRTRDELAAYRFAILSIEGEKRLGAGLTAEAQAELEDWILNRASVRFVCPQSQTEYVPGQTKSPVSGIPHYDYIAVERRDR